MSVADGTEVRNVTTIESRVDVASGRHIIGFPIVFNKLSEDLGGGLSSWREIILPEAVDRTLREGIDVRALVNHNDEKVLGRLTAGTMTQRKDPRGIRVDIDPPKVTYAKDILELIARKDVTGMSFRFRVMGDDGAFWDFEVDPPVRYIRDMRYSEVSVVTFPAYTDTEVALRSLEAQRRGWKPSVKFRERMIRAGNR